MHLTVPVTNKHLFNCVSKYIKTNESQGLYRTQRYQLLPIVRPDAWFKRT